VTPNPAAPSPDDSRSRRLRRRARWLAATIVTALVGVVATFGAGWFERWYSERRPLRAVVVSPSGPGAPGGGPDSPTGFGVDGFMILVPDRDRLPANIAQIDDCATLWAVGLAAGGAIVRQTDTPDTLINVQGNATTGTTITGIRARITGHAPTPDGVLLYCPPEPRTGAGQEPIRLSVDFSAVDLASTDVVAVRRVGGADVRQFEEGFTISLARDESVELAVSAVPAIEDLDWHIEVDTVVGGAVRTVVIDAGGRPLHTAGRRGLDDYREGHSGEQPGWDNGPALDWGLDPDAVAVAAAGGRAVRWRDLVTIPFAEGLDVYVPYGSGNGHANRYREIRYRGRTIVSFNPPAVVAQRVEVSRGARCGVNGETGTIAAVDPPATAVRRHGGADYEHRTVDYTCAAPRGGEERYRVESVRRVGSTIVFHSDLREHATDAERRLARDILRGYLDASV
jgi:hypothetical protein